MIMINNVSEVKTTTTRNKGKSLIEFPDNFIVFDIETTGLNPKVNEIIEIGALKVQDNKIVDTFSCLIKPKYKIDGFITSLTGISNEMVQNAPSIREVLPKFLDFIGNEILVGHNVNFDINFIYDSLVANELGILTNDFIDTLRISRKVIPQLRRHRLGDLSKYYKIDYSGSHRSLKDSEITLAVYYKLKEDSKENLPQGIK